jgi:biofilm PGA synthesis protein PgaD
VKYLIIEHPEWQTPKQKYFIGFVTLGFWMLWFYLWAPLISLIAWLFGIHVFQYQMIELGGYKGVLRLMTNYAIVIVVMGGSLILWATYNIQRFGGMDRRLIRPLVSTEILAKKLNIDADYLEILQKTQVINIENGQIHAVHE